MSLHGRFEYRWPPRMEDYKRAALIPEAERCTHCEGLGTARVRHSDFGPDQGKDWQECFTCEGTGRKDAGRLQRN